jgi:hypothetical protein
MVANEDVKWMIEMITETLTFIALLVELFSFILFGKLAILHSPNNGE